MAMSLNYSVTMKNTGDVALTGVTVVDPLTGQTAAASRSRWASQVYNTSYAITQADLDGAATPVPTTTSTTPPRPT